MFLGEFNHNVDDKGRMSIPSRFRIELGETFYITKGFDDCLFVFPEDEWKVFVKQLNSRPLTNSQARALSRTFYSGAMECELDKQGRVNVSSKLREFSGIEKEVTIVGVGTRIEIWSKENWEKYNSPDNFNYNDLAEQMEGFGV